jgi:2-methylcitrate dehydratase PrpD
MARWKAAGDTSKASFRNGRSNRSPISAVATISQRWDTGSRPIQAGGLNHTTIDAALELIALDDIAHIDVVITNFAARRLTDKYPQTEESAKFSGPYLAAYTLVHGAPTFAAFTGEALHDEAVRSLARKVSLATYTEYADVIEDSPAKVTVTLNDGRKIERSKYYPSGTLQSPMSPAQIKAKFESCAAQAIDNSAAEKLYAMLSTIDERPSFVEFWPLLREG